MNNELNDRTIEQLQSNLRINKIISVVITIILAIFTIGSIYGLATKENTTTFIALFAVACSCCSLLPIPFEARKNIKIELKLRNSIDKF